MCCVAWFEEEEERGKREEATKKAMEKISGGTRGRAKSAGRGRECVTDWWAKMESEGENEWLGCQRRAGGGDEGNKMQT